MKLNRRELLGSALMGLVGVMGLATQAVAKKLNLVSESNKTAAVLKYKHDASKSARKDDSQICGNCIHYTNLGKVKGKDVGKCNLIMAGEVAKAGWCASWIKKPG